MVVIRLQRRGTKKVPHHRIVAVEHGRSPQVGRVLETLGQYNPAKNPAHFVIDESRFVYWVSCGAQVSKSVSTLVKRFKKISIASVKK